MRPNRPRFVLSVVAVIASGVAVSVPPSALAAQCGSVQSVMGKWSAVDVAPTPSVPVEAASPVAATTVVGQDPSVLLSTDGVSVYRSTDGGCKWQTTYTLGPADYWNGGGVATGYSITNIANGHSAVPAGRQVVYLALSPNPYNAFTMVTLFGAAPPELMMVSRDGGQTFAPVQPAPSVAHPIVPECLTPPQAVVVPPSAPQEIYLECSSGLAQGVAESELVGGGEPAFRSLDGGQSWSLVGLPAYPQYGSRWFVAGPKAKELWIVGETYDAGASASYLGVWHSVDDGAHWSVTRPSAKAGVGIGKFGLAVDGDAGAGAERVIAFAPIGAFVSTDSGKHWSPLRGTEPASGLKSSQAFFVRHTAYVVATTSTSSSMCKPGVVVLRYANPRGRPASALFPTQWGNYANWGDEDSFTTVGGGSVAFGVATFCMADGKALPPKLLTFRAH